MNPEDIQSQLDNFQPGVAVDDTSSFISKTIPFNVGKLEIAPTYWQAGLIVLLLFVLVFALARLRRLYVNWSLNSFLPAVGLGFLLALIFEGFMIISGKTVLIALLGWKNAPKPISTALDEGRSELVKVLGVSENISVTEMENDYRKVISDFVNLNDEDKQKVNKYICTP